MPALRDRSDLIEELKAYYRYLMLDPVAVSLRAGDSDEFLLLKELPEPCFLNLSKVYRILTIPLLPDLLTEFLSRS